MLKGGENGPALVPGDANASLIYKRVAGLQQPIMPMRPVPPLSPAEITILKDWISQGTQWRQWESDQDVGGCATSAYSALQGKADNGSGPPVVGFSAADLAIPRQP